MTAKITTFRGVEASDTENRGKCPDTGPWVDEPDEVLWVDDASGLPCIMQRNSGFAWCGYVGVPRYAAHVVGEDMECHGGLSGNIGIRNSKDVPLRWAVALPDVNWDTTTWPGFDCGHLQDITPKYSSERPQRKDSVYRDAEYVMNECRRLAAQVRAALDRVNDEGDW